MGKLQRYQPALNKNITLFSLTLTLLTLGEKLRFEKKVNDDNNMLIQIETVFVKYIHHEACLCQDEIWR